MKRFLSLSFMLLLSLGIVSGQGSRLQRVIVKTKGTLMDDGSVKSGKRIDGALIYIRNGNTWISDKNGEILFIAQGETFAIDDVKKEGYRLSDPDIIHREIHYTQNSPLYLLLEIPLEQKQHELNIEYKIRTTLMNNIRKKEHEIDSLQQVFAITEEEYQRRIQTLLDEQERSSMIVKSISQIYANIDFDRATDFDREFTHLLLCGELNKADSLLKLRGNIEKDIEALTHLKSENNRMEEELNKSFVQEKYSRNDIAEYCLNKHILHTKNNQPDSAAYYIEKRAQCDTTNILWQYDAASYIAHKMGNRVMAEPLYNRALRHSILQYGEADSCTMHIKSDMRSIFNQ